MAFVIIVEGFRGGESRMGRALEWLPEEVGHGAGHGINLPDSGMEKQQERL